MDDLFNFGNTDNILGNIASSPSATSSILNPSSNRLNPQNHYVSNDLIQNNDKKKKEKDAIKLVIVGDPQVGKTTFLTKHLNGSFNAAYNATIGASTFNLQFNTNLDSHKYDVLDVAGQNLFAGKRSEYYKDIKGAIIMYDVMNWTSYDNVADVWLKELRQYTSNIVIVGNKMENRETRKVSVEVVAEAISNKYEPDGIGYCEISVKTNQNLAKPFLFLTKRILNINDSSGKALYFVSKISELNLIESMLQHKKDKDEKAMSDAKQMSSSPTQDLDNLFLDSTSPTKSDEQKTQNQQSAAQYLDNVMFQFEQQNDPKKGIAEKQSDQNDDYLNDMMKVKKNIEKNNLLNLNEQKNEKTASKLVAKPLEKVKPNRKTTVVSKTSSKKKQEPKVVASDNSIIIDMLLGMQETMQSLQSDVRKLQNDVNSIKEHIQKSTPRRSWQ